MTIAPAPSPSAAPDGNEISHDPGASARSLVIVLGDQLDPGSSAFDDFDPRRDVVWMAEVREESTHVWSSRIRIALFLSAMRHHAVALRALGRRVDYVRLDEAGNAGTLAGELARALTRWRPERVLMTAPGDWRVLKSLRAAAGAAGHAIEVRDDRHFFCTVREFAAFAEGRKDLRMETFYRHMRRQHRVLMDGDEPVGDRWNFDAENQRPFPPAGPGFLPERVRVPPDALTSEVLVLVEREFPDHPGTLSAFDWPVTREQARLTLDRFIEDRLPEFGHWQDAMWPGTPWLWHAQLSAALNLKLIGPREVVARAEQAWRDGKAPLPSVEGFIRQVLGWREYVRGVYWTRMPAPSTANALEYIERMSSGQHCARCRYRPELRTGPTACPYTTLYWDFLLRHEDRFSRHQRLGAQVRHLERLSDDEVRDIRVQAQALRQRFAA